MNKYLLMTCAMLMAVPAYASTDKLIDNVKNKNIDAVETLLAKGENVNGANAQGNTALHYAVATGNVDMVKLLLAHNADINAVNSKGWTPLKIAEKKNVGEIYNVLEEKAVSDNAALEEAVKAAEKAKAETAKKAQRVKEAQAKIKAEKAALTQKAESKKTAVKETVANSAETAKNSLKKAEANTVKAKASAPKTVKSAAKKQTLQNHSILSSKIYQGDEEVVYCLQYLGLQGEQKNMTVAASYYAAENGVGKARYDAVAAEAQHYFENASADDIKARADECGKYITPSNTAPQNKIIRSINKSIGF